MENRFGHRDAASIICDPQLESKRLPGVLVDLATRLNRRTQIQAAEYFDCQRSSAQSSQEADIPVNCRIVQLQNFGKQKGTTSAPTRYLLNRPAAVLS